MSSVLPVKPAGCCFTWNDPLRPLPPVFTPPPPVQNIHPTTPGICYSSNPSHPMPRHRGTRKGAKACSEVPERVSPCPSNSSPQTTSSILPHTPASPWGPNGHVQDYPWSPGLPHGVRLRLSNPPRATQPRNQVPPTATLYAPSPIRLHHSGCPILEQTAG